MRVCYRQGPFDGHGTGQEKSAQAESCHANPEKGAQKAGGVDPVPVQVSPVHRDDYGACQKLSEQVRQRQRSDAKQERPLPFILLFPVGYVRQRESQRVAHHTGDHHGDGKPD